MKETVAVIVDGMSTGAHYAPLFRGNGVKVVHVQSATEMPPLFQQTFAPHDYIRNIIHTGDLQALANALSDYRVLCVLPGGDAAIALSDAIAELVGAPHRSDKAKSLAKYDKYEMVEVLHHHGIRAAKQFKVTDWGAQRDQVLSTISLPAVIKPLQSAGGDGVRICRDFAEVDEWILHIVGRKTIFGKASQEIVIQEYIEGGEYMVDTVTLNGVHKLLSIWEVSLAQGAHPYPLFCRTLSRHDPVESALFEYVASVLDAVGHEFGPAHTEVRLGRAGPVMVEVNARLHGRLDPSVVSRTTGTNQPLWTVMSVLEGVPFVKDADVGVETKGWCMQVLLTTKRGGLLKEPPDWSHLEKLTSFHSVQSKLQPGKSFPPTISLTTVLGVVHLFHTDHEQLLEDCRYVLGLEGVMFHLH
jgi:hypothetical protein